MRLLLGVWLCARLGARLCARSMACRNEDAAVAADEKVLLRDAIGCSDGYRLMDLYQGSGNPANCLEQLLFTALHLQHLPTFEWVLEGLPGRLPVDLLAAVLRPSRPVFFLACLVDPERLPGLVDLSEFLAEGAHKYGRREEVRQYCRAHRIPIGMLLLHRCGLHRPADTEPPAADGADAGFRATAGHVLAEGLAGGSLPSRVAHLMLILDCIQDDDLEVVAELLSCVQAAGDASRRRFQRNQVEAMLVTAIRSRAYRTLRSLVATFRVSFSADLVLLLATEAVADAGLLVALLGALGPDRSVGVVLALAQRHHPGLGALVDGLAACAAYRMHPDEARVLLFLAATPGHLFGPALSLQLIRAVARFADLEMVVGCLAQAVRHSYTEVLEALHALLHTPLTMFAGRATISQCVRGAVRGLQPVGLLPYLLPALLHPYDQAHTAAIDGLLVQAGLAGAGAAAAEPESAGELVRALAELDFQPTDLLVRAVIERSAAWAQVAVEHGADPFVFLYDPVLAGFSAAHDGEVEATRQVHRVLTRAQARRVFAASPGLRVLAMRGGGDGMWLPVVTRVAELFWLLEMARPRGLPFLCGLGRYK